LAGLSGILPEILQDAPWRLNDHVDAAEVMDSSAWLGFLATLAAVVGGIMGGLIVDRTHAFKVRSLTYKVHVIGLEMARACALWGWGVC
jgi:hypothetical protein